MKKALLIGACLVFSNAAFAVQYGTSGIITPADCDALNEDVKVTLTNGVVAGAECNPGAIAFATCHTGGRTTSRTVEDLNCTSVADVDRFGNATTVQTCVPFDPPQYSNKTGAQMATVSTVQPSVVLVVEDGVTCSAANAETAAGDRL